MHFILFKVLECSSWSESRCMISGLRCFNEVQIQMPLVLSFYELLWNQYVVTSPFVSQLIIISHFWLQFSVLTTLFIFWALLRVIYPHMIKTPWYTFIQIWQLETVLFPKKKKKEKSDYSRGTFFLHYNFSEFKKLAKFCIVLHN